MDPNPFSQFANLGALTQTTPTITPTTLKKFEDSIRDLADTIPQPMQHQHQAGFVPPVVNVSYMTSMSNNNGTNNNAILNHQQVGDEGDDADEDLSEDSSQSYNQDSCDGSVGNNDNANNPKSETVKVRATSGRKPRNDKVCKCK